MDTDGAAVDSFEPLNDEIQILIKELLSRGLQDADILLIIKEKHPDSQLCIRQLRQIRQQLKLPQRRDNCESDEVQKELISTVQKELDSGFIQGFGREHLYTHFRQQGHSISRDRLFKTVQLLDPDGIKRRLNDLQRHRGSYIVPGPNYLWSIDGYCKLQHWGIEIYAAIDAYSRYIVLIYIGITNRTAASVLRQFLDVLQATSTFPQIIRSDRGTETSMIAAAQLKLHQATESNTSLNECYRFGTSTLNQRIESWWGQLAKQLTNYWRRYFLNLSHTGLYHTNTLSDRIAFLAVYMPIIRQEVTNYYDLKPDSQVLSELHMHFENWDINEYLPLETKNWCQNQISKLGFSSGRVTAAAVNKQGERLHKIIYLQLRKLVHDHIRSQQVPILQESEKPTGAWDWLTERLQEHEMNFDNVMEMNIYDENSGDVKPDVL
ncbi:uncharacterized protein PADG_08629 [Paracoccidioides brasiliensis Pb18]|uniref:Integrase core domain-containing protein n=1 Tax=Paracoccidioides brasiliensis (strain Pb18) TaxID=502780 RepID=C1GMX8_PARBD|nr:uncharacterized protein PADG_08629 [Paracoccidioides brasiliensis Pb18]EEH44980.2 hypothetical protein PADG_08629 [Paracoccidioides brasiliensis Pb18]